MADQEKNEALHKSCDKALVLAMGRNKAIHKLIDSIVALGCEIPKDFLSCRPCEDQISGGFVVNSGSEKSYKPQIILCENRRLDSETFENTIVHELIHAYDVCRVKSFDWTNCVHHACTEIRASALSGECAYLHEVMRGHPQIANGHRDCVKRRAEKSLSMNLYCKVQCCNLFYDSMTSAETNCLLNRTWPLKQSQRHLTRVTMMQLLSIVRKNQLTS